MKKILIAVGISLGLVVGGAAAPSFAHVPKITVTCDGVHIQGSSYDDKKTNTWTVSLDGVVTSGTFGESVDELIPVPQGGKTTTVGAQIADEDMTPAYSEAFSGAVGPCGVKPPVVIPPILCTSTGAWYTEADDNAPDVTNAGVQFTSKGNAKAVGYVLPVNGNLQGISNIDYVTKNTVGNGVFFRFIVDLTGDGLGAYNSFSITSKPINQASVADVGSKAIFLGKTVAQVAALYPNNKIVGIGIQTGSSYAAGDGALLTSLSGDCGALNFVKPPVVVPPKVTPPAAQLAVTGVEVWQYGVIGGGLGLLGAALLYAGQGFRLRKGKHHTNRAVPTV